MKPFAVQLKRTKGWRLPPGTIVVSRPSKWGNPFDWQESRDEYGCTELEAKQHVKDIYYDWLHMIEPERFGEGLRGQRVAILASIPDLRGMNLACWCAIGDPCHRSVLLEMANK